MYTRIMRHEHRQVVLMDLLAQGMLRCYSTLVSYLASVWGSRYWLHAQEFELEIRQFCFAQSL